MDYIYKNKEWLIKQINKYGYVNQIARETGQPKTCIRRYIDKYNLRSLLRTPTKDEIRPKENLEKYPYKDKKWLQDQLGIFKTVPELCKQTGYPSTSVRRYIKKYNLSYEAPPIKRTLSINEKYFESIDMEHKAYWLGLLMADGNAYCKDKKYCIRITLKNEDSYLLDQFLNDLESEAKVSYDNYGRGTARVFCKKLFYDIAKYGIIPNKTGKEQLPVLPEHLYRHFVRGFFDGDGTIYMRKNRKRHKCTIGWVCQNKDFLIDLNNLLLKHTGYDLGNLSFHKGNAFECKTESYNKCKAIMSWLYKDATIAMIRKYEKAKLLLNIDCPSLEQFKEEFKLTDGDQLRAFYTKP